MRKKSKKKTQTPNPQGPEYATGSAAPVGQTGGPRGAGECGHHVDTLRHQPHEDAREAAMGTRVSTSQAIQKRSRARTEKERGR